MAVEDCDKVCICVRVTRSMTFVWVMGGRRCGFSAYTVRPLDYGYLCLCYHYDRIFKQWIMTVYSITTCVCFVCGYVL